MATIVRDTGTRPEKPLFGVSRGVLIPIGGFRRRPVTATTPAMGSPVHVATPETPEAGQYSDNDRSYQ
jgi:hypothetical protein